MRGRSTPHGRRRARGGAPPPHGVLLASLIALGCSSGTFEVASSDAGVDPDLGAPFDGNVAPDGGGLDTAGPIDTGPGPCDPEEGKGKFCITVELERKEHPPYDATSGASGLGIDGKGVVWVTLFDRDPALADDKTPLVPLATLRYPSEDKVGAEIDVDKDLPVTLSGKAPQGAYWVLATFADNATAKRGVGEESVLPGDFVIVPEVKEKKSEYPKLAVTTGTVASRTLKLKPYRKIDIQLTVSVGLNTKAKSNTTIHGDGPTLFGLYDGKLVEASMLSVSGVRCLSVKPGDFSPPEVSASFGTTVDGEHNLLVALFDYSVDGFPSRGTLLVPTTPGGADPIPRVNISTTSWVGTTSARFTDVYLPYSIAEAPTDPFKCGS